MRKWLPHISLTLAGIAALFSGFFAIATAVLAGFGTESNNTIFAIGCCLLIITILHPIMRDNISAILLVVLASAEIAVSYSSEAILSVGLCFLDWIALSVFFICMMYFAYVKWIGTRRTRN